jgi:hypothetical protein
VRKGVETLEMGIKGYGKREVDEEKEVMPNICIARSAFTLKKFENNFQLAVFLCDVNYQN